MHYKDMLIILIIAIYFGKMRKESDFVWVTDILMGFALFLLLLKMFISYRKSK